VTSHFCTTGLFNTIFIHQNNAILMLNPVKLLSVLLFILLAFGATAQLNPVITSWVINTTGLTGYNCSGCTPAVGGNIPANVQSVYYDATYAYISTQSIPSYNIGPWASNPNTPSAQNKIFRFKQTPTNNATHTTTPLGNIGVWSNGVGVFNAKDGMSYNNAGVWNRNAYYYEGISFDACLGHPAPNGGYHNHVNPSCLYDATNTTVHSPIIGFAFDGYPIYGAYGYASPNGTGGIKRMVSSYALSPNTTRVNGPAVNATYPNGCFCEDYVFNAGSGDLDQYNGRTCVTPEYPLSTYAYFVTIDASGIPQYPFVVGPTYFGTYSTTNTVPSIPGGATQYIAPLPVELLDLSGINKGKANILNWSTVSESNNAGFGIEFSTDGENFEPLGFMPSKAVLGKSAIRLDYQYIDEAPAADLVYYRLKQSDLDGDFQYSYMISVNSHSKGLQVEIFPNPVTDNLIHLLLSDNSSDLLVNIVNAQGRTLVSRAYKALEYGPEIKLHAPYLGAGVYWLMLESAGNKTVRTIVLEAE
jgi:YHYH protein/Secretion system C-terminal sorting domain